MFSSIRARLTLSHLAVIVLAMGLSGLLLLSFLERYFSQATEDSLVAQAQITAQALIPGAQARGPSAEAEADGRGLPAAYNTLQRQQTSNLALQAENVQVPADTTPLGELDLDYLADASLQLATQLDTRIRILDTSGQVLVDSAQSGGAADLSGEPVIGQALAGRYASQTDAADVMHVALPALLDGQLVAVVYLSQPLNELTAVLGDLRTRWALSTAIALLLSAVVGLLLSGAIAQPVRRLTAAAGRVAEGELDQQVPARARDELGRLSRVFNEMTARLRSARQIQIDFVANVSHELRTPLTTIKGMVETLRDGAVDDLPVRDRFLATIEAETDRLIRLVRDLLLLSRADSAELNLKRRPVDLAELVERVLARLVAPAGERQLDLQIETRVKTPTVSVDPDRIEQVLVNLLDNAIQYSRPGGQVTVVLSAGPEAPRRGQGDWLLVQVCDQGIGIPADDLPRIGQRFYRADKARSRAQGGSGLGLAIAQAIVVAHGGRLWVESTEGQGTVVSLTLPTT